MTTARGEALGRYTRDAIAAVSGALAASVLWYFNSRQSSAQQIPLEPQPPTPPGSTSVFGVDSTFVPDTPTVTFVPSPSKTPTPTVTITPSLTPTETTTPTEIPNQYLESVRCDPENCLNGAIEVNPEGGKAYYLEILKSLLESGANDAYFETNFGINDPKATLNCQHFESGSFDICRIDSKNPRDPDALEKLLARLRETDYIMPEGLTMWAPFMETLIQQKELGEFKLDNVQVYVLDREGFRRKRFDESDPHRIKSYEAIYGDIKGGFIWAIRLIRGEDGFNRLNFIFASEIARGEPYDELTLAGLEPYDKPETIGKISNWLNFYPNLFLNLRNYSIFQGRKINDVSNNFYRFKFPPPAKVPVYEGSYNWQSATPDIALFRTKNSQ